MTSRTLAPLALALAIGACSNPKAAPEANFEAAIQEHRATQRACLSVAGHFPRDLLEGGSQMTKAEVLDEVLSAGLLASEPVRKEVPVYSWGGPLFSQRPMKTVEGKRYSVTEAGEAAVGVASLLSTTFCYGGYQVREVTNFTEPAATGGQTVSQASYTYAATEIADWARGSEILRGESRRLARDLASGSEPIKGQALLVLTDKGWIHAAMFGKQRAALIRSDSPTAWNTCRSPGRCWIAG